MLCFHRRREGNYEKISKPQGIGDALQIYKTCVKGYPSKSKRDELAAYEDKVDFHQ